MKNKNNYLLYFILICLTLGIYIFFSNDDSEDNYYQGTTTTGVPYTTEVPYTTRRMINTDVSFETEENRELARQLWDTLN